MAVAKNPVKAMVQLVLKLVALHGSPGAPGSYYYFTRPGLLEDAPDMMRLAAAADGGFAEYSTSGVLHSPHRPTLRTPPLRARRT